MCKECDTARGLSRREFLRYAVLGTGIAALGPMGGLLPSAEAAPMMPPGGQNIFVVLNLFGGNDGLNTVVPVNLSNYYVQRGALALDPLTVPLHSLDTGPTPSTNYMLHPALTNLAGMWADGDVAIVQKVGYPTANLSHFLSQDIWSLGVRGNFSSLPITRSGWIARFADRYATTPTGAVSIGAGLPLDFVGGSTPSLQVGQLRRFLFDADNRYQNNHLHRIETIKKALAATPRTGLSDEIATAIGNAHTVSGQVQQAVASFNDPGTYDPQVNIGRQMRDIAILVEGGFDTQLFFTGFGGFDHHSNQLTGQDNLLGRLDAALGAFADNMKALGVWNQMVIGIVSEFGRRNYSNGSAGTDHAKANALFFVGGAVNGGMYGPDITDPELGTDNTTRYLDYDVDFRSLYKEVISGHLNLDPAPIFPEVQEKTGVLGIV